MKNLYSSPLKTGQVLDNQGTICVIVGHLGPFVATFDGKMHELVDLRVIQNPSSKWEVAKAGSHPKWLKELEVRYPLFFGG